MVDFTELIPVSLAAQMLGLTPDSVRHLERSGKLPAFKLVTGQRLFLRGDVARLAAERARAKAEREAALEAVATDVA